MLTIALPQRLATVHLLAGIEFVDGVATVDQLGSNTRYFLEFVGATIADSDAPTPAPDVDAPAVDDADETPLAERTVAELREIADFEGIDLPSRATKAEILNALRPESEG